MVAPERARQVMVDGQLRAGGVTEPRLLSRFAALPREAFVPAGRGALAYVDELHWFGRPGASAFMAAPVTLGKLIHLAEITPADRVLDIGATTGYGTAIIAGLAHSVVGLEPDPQLAAAARANLAAQGADNASIASGDTAQFDPASFDVIILQFTVDSVPAEFIHLLREAGRLVALIRKGPVGTAHVYTMVGGKITERADFNASLPAWVGTSKAEEFVF